MEMQPEQRDFITPELVQAVRDATEQLKSKGWAIVPSLFEPAECDDYLARYWKALGHATNGALHPEADYTGLRGRDLPPHSHGILLSHRANHAACVREMRADPRAIFVHAALQNTDQLWSSLDRVCFKFPGRVYRAQQPWPHFDQTPRRTGLLYVQSYVTMMDAPLEEPSNQFYEGSHLVFGERWAYKRSTTQNKHFNLLTQEEAAKLGEKCPLVKPVLKKGDMLLWDSRTVHSPSDGTSAKQGRFVVYLCYSQLWGHGSAGGVDAKTKRLAFDNCLSTSHCPLPQKLNASRPDTRGQAAGPYDELDRERLGVPEKPTERERFLFGFDDYEGREGRLLGADWKERAGLATQEPLLKFESPFAKMLPAYEKPELQGPNKKKRRVGK
jgi:hypothetical protein